MIERMTIYQRLYKIYKKRPFFHDYQSTKMAISVNEREKYWRRACRAAWGIPQLMQLRSMQILRYRFHTALRQ